MSQFPLVSGKTAIKAFEKIGYCVVWQRGSHIRMHHQIKRPITVPNHKVLGKGLLKKLLRDTELSVADFVKLLKG